jgi:putative ABC transport system substrate-binding protein
MKPRFAVVLLAFGAIVCTSVQAQQVGRHARVGFLAPQGRSLPLFDAFRQGLGERGYVEGRNLVIEARFAEGQYDRLPGLIAELIGLKVDVLAVTGAVTARAAKKAVSNIPVVFAVVVDPVADGVVFSMEHPEANLTGVTSFDPQQATKQFQVFRQVIPRLKRVAILGDEGVSEALIQASEAQARALGIETQRLRLAGPNPDLEAAFDSMRREHVDGLLVLEEPLLGVYANRIAELAAKDHLPSLFAPSRVSSGGLIFYGTSQVEAIQRMTGYVDRILNGVKPSELPVEQVARYDFIVNLKTAQNLGLTIPPEVLKRADRVIQ